MTFAEGLGLFGAVITVALAAAGGFYWLGVQRGVADKNDKTVGDLASDAKLDQRFMGAQEVRNAGADAIAGEVRKLAGDVRAVTELQHAHETQDDKRFASVDNRFDRMEKMMRDGFSQLSAQMQLVASGRAGKLYEVHTPNPTTGD